MWNCRKAEPRVSVDDRPTDTCRRRHVAGGRVLGKMETQDTRPTHTHKHKRHRNNASSLPILLYYLFLFLFLQSNFSNQLTSPQLRSGLRCSLGTDKDMETQENETNQDTTPPTNGTPIQLLFFLLLFLFYSSFVSCRDPINNRKTSTPSLQAAHDFTAAIH